MMVNSFSKEKIIGPSFTNRYWLNQLCVYACLSDYISIKLWNVITYICLDAPAEFAKFKSHKIRGGVNLLRSIILPVFRYIKGLVNYCLPRIFVRCHHTCQMWMWFKGSNRYFDKIRNSPYRDFRMRIFRNHHLWFAHNFCWTTFRNTDRLRGKSICHWWKGLHGAQ